MPSFLLTDNGSQFVVILFQELRVGLKVRHLTETSYHPQTNDQF